MKRLFVGMAVLAILFSSCENETLTETPEEQDLTLELDQSYHEQCATMGALEESILNNPSLKR